jgi:hypothetical protein
VGGGPVGCAGAVGVGGAVGTGVGRGVEVGADTRRLVGLVLGVGVGSEAPVTTSVGAEIGTHAATSSRSSDRAKAEAYDTCLRLISPISSLPCLGELRQVLLVGVE